MPKLKQSNKTNTKKREGLSKKLEQGLCVWVNFYRHNPQRFVRDYLHIDLKLFQKILLYAMMHNHHFMYLASRGHIFLNINILYIRGFDG